MNTWRVGRLSDSRFPVLTLVLLGLSVGNLAAQLPLAGFPSTHEARREFFREIPVDPASEPLVERDLIRAPGAGDVVLRMRDEAEHRFYAFLPMDTPDGPRRDGPGSWEMRQRLSDGAWDRIIVYLHAGGASRVTIRPRSGLRTLQMEVTLAGETFYRNVNLPMTMERALSAGFDEIVAATAGLVNWDIAFPDPSDPGYTRVAAMLTRIRAVLPDLPDAEDGALGRDGQFRFIATGLPMEEGGFNCSGFAKWIADGLYAAGGGPLLPIDALRVKHLAYRGTRWSRRLEQTRDPYFGLDWTRNIALHLLAAEEGAAPSQLDPESRDVRSVPFVRYREDIGYDTDLLRPVLYWLASRAPGTIYFGSVNLPGGDDEVLRQHSHVVVLLPFFDPAGVFRVAVMERNRESSLTALAARYPGSFTHLVRVDVEGAFNPPPLPGPAVPSAN